MAYAGQIIDNPASGERITFRKTAADTGGELLELDVALTPDGQVPGALFVREFKDEVRGPGTPGWAARGARAARLDRPPSRPRRALRRAGAGLRLDRLPGSTRAT